MNHDSYDDNYIRGILNTVKTIAMVGVSAECRRPSYFAFKYLLERRYHMIPVNPGLAGGELLGQKVYGKLADIPEPVDMVDIFRASQYALGIVQEALAMNPRPKVIWMQLGVRNDEAAALAEANGMKVVMNRCPKIEYGRLSSEIAWMGVNTRTLTSKPRQNPRRRHPAHGARPRHHLGGATTAADGLADRAAEAAQIATDGCAPSEGKFQAFRLPRDGLAAIRAALIVALDAQSRTAKPATLTA